MANNVVKRQVYTFEIVHYDDGTSTMKRNNEGFSVMEILGITALVQSDMTKLLAEAVEKFPTNIERTSKDSPIIHTENASKNIDKRREEVKSKQHECSSCKEFNSINKPVTDNITNNVIRFRCVKCGAWNSVKYWP